MLVMRQCLVFPMALSLTLVILVAVPPTATTTFAASPGVEDELEQRFLDGLLQRRLFSLAEFHCRDHMENVSLSTRAAPNGRRD